MSKLQKLVAATAIVSTVGVGYHKSLMQIHIQ